MFFCIYVTRVDCLCKIGFKKSFLFIHKTIYIKTKFRLTDAISGIKTTKPNITMHLFQMKNNKSRTGSCINCSRSTYQRKELLTRIHFLVEYSKRLLYRIIFM